MVAYYIGLAWRAMRRAPVMSSLIVVAIGLGIGASMTMLTVLHVMTHDPIPQRSSSLYVAHIDPLPLNFKQQVGVSDPSDSLTWPDAQALLSAMPSIRQAAMAGGELTIDPQQNGLLPFPVGGRYATSNFFAMFDVPLQEGAFWTRADDNSHARVVVITASVARELFPGTSAIGKTILLAGLDNATHAFRVVGVTSVWAPKPMFYADTTAKRFSDADQFFLPLTTAIDLQLPITNNVTGWEEAETESWRTSDKETWLQFWVRLDSAEEKAAYQRFLVGYSAQQKTLGRFQRDPNEAKVIGLMDWLAHEKLVPTNINIQVSLALGFLLVCTLNTISLLLAKFMRRKGEISTRRAMGARRVDIFVQLGVESAFIGLAGGLLGLAIAQLGLWAMRQRPDDYAHLARMDLSMLIGTVILSVAVTMVAGLLPAWRACCLPPALQLKEV